MKIVFLRQPHAGQAGKVIDLIDAVQGIIHQVPIEHRTSDILHFGQRAGRRLQIEHAHAATALDEGRDQMLPDEAAAAGDEDPCHVWGCGSRWRCSEYCKPPCRAGSGARSITTARSCRKPSAMNSFAITNIGPSSKWAGLSTSAGCRRSSTRCPMICDVTPITINTAVIDHIAAAVL